MTTYLPASNPQVLVDAIGNKLGNIVLDVVPGAGARYQVPALTREARLHKLFPAAAFAVRFMIRTRQAVSPLSHSLGNKVSTLPREARILKLFPAAAFAVRFIIRTRKLSARHKLPARAVN
ncbi:hypothetical protein NLJ89_g3691 [Agrocybe chaxingu]|uniref:Uncharacterized protein n=1 Tax=Agrocybe chaxingu TaxID=84603 RepID=A0A9W8K583_9AGAR|nr:hypothetical protein NLJ89_g3691 [Agrocybe chaxingu]